MGFNESNKKTASSLIWSFIDLFSRHGISLIIQIILARVLLPSDFGLIGMTMIFVTLSHALVNSGFDQALIREDNVGKRELSTVFYFNILFSLIVYAMTFIFAPLISEYYSEERVTLVVRILMLIVVFNGFTIVQRVLLIRQLNFKLQARITVASTSFSGIIAIILALNGAGVWSLVFQQISMQFMISLLLFLSVRWIPSLIFDFGVFKNYFKFGYKLLIGGTVDTFSQNLPNIILGRLYGTYQLGYYTNARKISTVISSTIGQSIQRVSYPVLSGYKNNHNSLIKNHLNLSNILMMFYFPIITVLINSAPSFIPMIFGVKWEPSVIIFQILLIHSLLYPLITLNLSIFKVINRTDLYLRMNVISFLILLLIMFGTLFFTSSYISIVLAFSLHQIIYYILITLKLKYIINYNIIKQCLNTLRISIPSILIFVVGIILNRYLSYDFSINVLIHLFVGMALSVLLSLVFCLKEVKMTIKFLK